MVEAILARRKARLAEAVPEGTAGEA
jgi:hypothetical protein